jgi:hypothetical protein
MAGVEYSPMTFTITPLKKSLEFRQQFKPLPHEDKVVVSSCQCVHPYACVFSLINNFRINCRIASLRFTDCRFIKFVCIFSFEMIPERTHMEIHLFTITYTYTIAHAFTNSFVPTDSSQSEIR